MAGAFDCCTASTTSETFRRILEAFWELSSGLLPATPESDADRSPHARSGAPQDAAWLPLVLTAALAIAARRLSA